MCTVTMIRHIRWVATAGVDAVRVRGAARCKGRPEVAVRQRAD